jgi:hypothetical protein
VAKDVTHERLAMPDPKVAKVESWIANLGVGPVDYTNNVLTVRREQNVLRAEVAV